MPQAHAPSICAEHSASVANQAMLRAHATRICTDGRTDEQTKTVAHLNLDRSLTDTCARVPNRIDAEVEK